MRPYLARRTQCLLSAVLVLIAVLLAVLLLLLAILVLLIVLLLLFPILILDIHRIKSSLQVLSDRSAMVV